ncbi:MAG: DUF6528 family protein [Clostridia bacterium]|nr:DUF6528 family protein [Clostridia bacterium]
MILSKKHAAAAMLLACLLTVSCVGCTQGTPAVTTDAADTETSAPAEELLDLKEYKVIRPEKADKDVVDSAVTVKNALSTENFIMPIETDWIRDVSQLPPKACEILVGHTNRPESEEVYKTVRDDETVIRVFPESGRIVVAGGGSAALQRAAEAFCGLVSDTLTLPQSTSVVKTGKEHTVTSLSVDGKPITDFCLVTEAKADRDVKAAAFVFAERIKEYTGFSLKTVTGAAPAGMSPITFEKNDAAEIITDVSSSGISLKAPGGYVVSAAASLADSFVPEGSAGAVTAPASSGKRPAFTPTERPDYIADRFGTVPVALVDQKNACAAIYDFAPVLSGGQPALKSTFAPSASAGFTFGKNYGQRIDEFRVRFSEKRAGLVAGFTSSSGYVALADLETGKCIWEQDLSGMGPHSADYIPNGNVALALSGNSDDSKACVRVYFTSSGKKNESHYVSVNFSGAHAVVWDDVRGVLWAFGYSFVKAYYLGSDPSSPVLTEIPCYTSNITMGGHDLSAVPGNDDLLFLGGNGCAVFNKTTGSVQKSSSGLLQNGGTKCICALPDGQGGIMMFETVAANVYASHDTDTLFVWKIPAGAQGSPLNAADVSGKIPVTFSSRAFYKARVIDPFYNR